MTWAVGREALIAGGLEFPRLGGVWRRKQPPVCVDQVLRKVFVVCVCDCEWVGVGVWVQQGYL